MKVVSTEALTKLIQLVKSAFIKVDDVVEVTEIETETPNEVELATVATTGSYDDLSNKPTNVSTFTNDAGYITNTALVGYATESYVTSVVSGKQDTLVSGTNIKTINNVSLLGSGNIDIQGGGGSSYTAGTGIDITNDVISAKIATSVSSTSTNEQSVGAKLFYDTCGDIESAINTIRGV